MKSREEVENKRMVGVKEETNGMGEAGRRGAVQDWKSRARKK